MKRAIAVAAFCLLPLCAQEFKFPESLDRLAAKAKEKVSVTLDGSMLQMASSFLSGKSSDEAKIKQLTGNLKGIYVRSFEFAKEGEYSEEDLAPVRSQLTAARGWSRIVDVSEGAEQTQVYLRKDGEKMAGVAVIAGEKRELTVVYIDGPIDLKNLSDLVKIGVDVDLSAATGKK